MTNYNFLVSLKSAGGAEALSSFCSWDSGRLQVEHNVLDYKTWETR